MVQRKQPCLAKVRWVEHTLWKCLPTTNSFCREKSRAEISLQLNQYCPLWIIKAERCWQSQGWRCSLCLSHQRTQILSQMMHLHLTPRLLQYLSTPCFQPRSACYIPSKTPAACPITLCSFPKERKKCAPCGKESTFFSQEARRSQGLLHEPHQLGTEKDWEAKGRKSGLGRWKRM